MTTSDKTYWVRKKNSIGPGMPNGRLYGKNYRGKTFWTEKPGAAVPIVGGEILDRFLANNADTEVIEVVQKGTRRYAGKTVAKWVPKGA